MKTETNATSKTISIDGMHGDVCVQKVTAALKHVPGVITKSVSVGSAVIEADQAGCDSACAAINKAGYKSHLKAGDKSSDKSNQTDGKYSDGKMADGKMTDGKMADGKMTDGKMADSRSNSASKPMSDKDSDDESDDKSDNKSSGNNQGSGHNQKSNKDHATVGNANKAVELKTGNHSQPAKSH